MRVVVTGMGGELGTRVALLLEAEREVESVLGLDIDPPRRRLRRAEFHRVDPRERRRVVGLVRDFEPTAVVHLGIYEPDARSTPRAARERTSAGTVAVVGAAAESPSIDRIVMRSGIEVYGRRRGAVMVPAEDVPPDPSSAFGHSLLHAESVAGAAARSADVPLAVVRMAPVMGPHFPSPLGRYLRLPVVPVSAFADPPFSVLHQEDAAASVVAALLRKVDGPVNVVAPGAVTASQAARLGNRVPLPLLGPAWQLARRLADLAGSPVPDHLLELLTRGRGADGSRAAELLGAGPLRSTPEVVRELYDWAPVTPLRVVEGDAA